MLKLKEINFENILRILLAGIIGYALGAFTMYKIILNNLSWLM